jgi:dTDP-glucose 4,6-dehydratase
MSKKTTNLLITGGSGFLGRNLVDLLKKDTKYRIFSVSRAHETGGVENIFEDLTKTDFSFLDKIKPDFIVYFGTVSSPNSAAQDPEGSYESNVIAVNKLLAKVAKMEKKVKKIILMSSAVLYKNTEKGVYKETDKIDPYRDPYNFSKFSMECLANYYRSLFSLPITVFRLSNTYGPYQPKREMPTLVSDLFQQAMEHRKIKVLNVKPVRDWIYAGDVCRAIQKELNAPESGIFNLATGKGRSVGDVTAIISRLTGASFVNLDKKALPPMRIVCSTQRLRKHLGYVPSTPLTAGLKKVYEYYKKKKAENN